MDNSAVAQLLEDVADLLEIQAENLYRIRAYRAAARSLRDLAEPLESILADPARRLDELPGIGKDLAAKIVTILTTGDLPLRQELLDKAPLGLREVLNIPGVGPKKAMLLHQQLNIKSVDDLRSAAQAKRIRGLKGFGLKTEQRILEAVDKIEETGRRMYLADAQAIAEAVLDHLRQAPGMGQLAMAGSYRRRQETIGDLDVLVTCANPSSVMDHLAAYPFVVELLARGETKMSVRLRSSLQLDLRVVPQESFGAALQYFTGSKQHNILVRRRALARDLKVNEYGVYRDSQQVAGQTEEDVYAAIGLPWIPPELREGRGEIELAERGALPDLLELSELRGDLHMHTDVTDGRASLEQMVHAARDLGYAYIAITDHSKRVTMARGLDADRLRAHWETISHVAARFPELAVLKGIEMDILEDGQLDLPDDVLAEADWVIASIHYGQGQSREQLTQRMLNAIENPYVSMIAHPTGRIIGKRRPYELDLETVLDAAAQHGCMMELNCQPGRLDLTEVALAAAKQRGVRIVLNTDAHSVEELRYMQFGVYQARRAGLQAADVANTLPLDALRRLLKQRSQAGGARHIVAKTPHIHQQTQGARQKNLFDDLS